MNQLGQQFDYSMGQVYWICSDVMEIIFEEYNDADIMKNLKYDIISFFYL